MAYGNGTNSPTGLQSRFTNVSSTLSGQQFNASIASGYATGLFSGDPVALSGGSLVICPAGTPALGVFGGCTFTDTLGNYFTQPFWPAGQTTLGSVAATATIITDPNILFDIQASTSQNVSIAGATITAAQIGLNANFALAGGPAGANLTTGGITYAANPTTGNTRTGLSGYYLDVSTISSDPSLSLQIVGFTPAIGNVGSAICNNVIVTLNNKLFSNAIPGNNLNSSNITKITGATTAYTVVSSDVIIDVDNTDAQTVTVTLPAATVAYAKGQKYTIKDSKGSANTNNITVNGGGTNIDGAATATISSAYGKLTVYSDGLLWFSI